MPRLPLVPHQGGAEASSSWFMVQSPMSISILPACERRRARAQCKRGYRERKWNKAFNRILRSWGKYNTPGQLPWQIWHRSGCLAHLKNPLHVTFIFCGEKYLSVFFMPLLTLQPSLAEDLKCTGLGSVRIPLTQIRGFSPQLEGQLRSLHCNIENSSFRQCKTFTI